MITFELVAIVATALYARVCHAARFLHARRLRAAHCPRTGTQASNAF